MSEDPLERPRRFRELYDANFDLIRRYARRRVANSVDADDVVAETLLVAWRRLDELPPTAQQPAWLYGVARRVLANQRRAAKRREALTNRLRNEGAQSHDDAEGLVVPAPLEAAFDRLPESDRELLGLAYWEELDPGQIAVALGCSRNAVRIRLHRARRRLARELQAERGPKLAGLWLGARRPTDVVPTKETR